MTCTLPNAFQYKDRITYSSIISILPFLIDISLTLTYHSQHDFIKCWSTVYIPSNVTTLTIPNNKCNEESITTLNLSIFPNLQVLTIGNNCFSNVNVLNFTAFSALISISIGYNSFTIARNSYGYNLNHKFYLRNCPALKELVIGRFSFSDFTTCVIENVPKLELIEMGTLGVYDWSYNFCYASLNLQGRCNTLLL